MTYRPLALAAAALVAGMLSFGGGAEAANVMTGASAPAKITKFQDNNIQEVRHRKWRRHSWRWRHRHRHRPGVFLGLGLGFPFFGPTYHRPYYYDDYYDDYYYVTPRRSSSRHVRWCLNRYVSYNPRTDSFKGFDGRRHRCRSPYRY